MVAMLRRLGVPSATEAAGLIEPSWTAAQKPVWVDPYVGDCGDVADVFLNQPLKALCEKQGGLSPGTKHPLRDLVPDPVNAASFMIQLGTFLGRRFNCPDSGPVATFPWRLVPAAAQMAIAQPEVPGPPVDLDNLQQVTLEYQQGIPKPNKLAVPADRSAYYHRLVEEALKFEPSPVGSTEGEE
jgi:hypothetical protein